MLPISARLSSFLDASRWMAAAAVLLEHARIITLDSYHPGATQAGWLVAAFYFATGFGRIAVVVFFVLSGFLVGGEVARSLSGGTFTWKEYAIKRFMRLYPVYLFALGAGFAFDHAGLHFANSSGLYTEGGHFPGLNFSVAERLAPHVLAANLAFLQGITTPVFGSNEPLWSVAYEAWYYLLFPLVLWPLFMRGAPAAARIAALAAAGAVAFLIKGEMLSYFLVWLIGMLPHLAGARVRIPLPLGLAALALAVLVARTGFPAARAGFGTYLVVALAFSLCIVGFARGGQAPLPGDAVHRRLASFSYSLYAVHWPLMLVAVAMTQQAWSVGLRMAPRPGAFLYWGALVVAGYGWGWCAAQCTEYPAPRIRDRLFAWAGVARTRHAAPR